MRALGLGATPAAHQERAPGAENLIGPPLLDSTHKRSISWRDSNAGYANGRFAMDINAIWVPRALEAVGEILGALRTIGFSNDQIAAFMPDAGAAPFA